MSEMSARAESQQPSLADLLLRLRRMLPDLEKRYHVRELALFGSYVHGDETESSDLDVMVEFDQVPSLLTFIALEHELSDALGLKVDLVLRRAIKPRILQRVAREAVPV